METPKVWAQICIQRMVELAKETTTMRRVLDPTFIYFDFGRFWTPRRGLAVMVLSDMSYYMESSGLLISLWLVPPYVPFVLFLMFEIHLYSILWSSYVCRSPCLETKISSRSGIRIGVYIGHFCQMGNWLMFNFFFPGNQQLILASLIHHLDHKNVAQDPQLKSYVIQVATALARQIRSGSVLAEIGFVCDLCRHLRKSLQATVESVGEQESNSNILLQNSIEDCLLEIAKGVSLILLWHM